jgi:hypothetical protein
MTEPITSAEPRRVIGEFDTYLGLLAALRERVAQLDVSGERLDELAGLPRGYFQKLIGTRPRKRLGVQSLGDVFGALAIKAVLVEDEAALARISSRLVRRKYAVPSVTTQMITIELSRRHMRKIQQKGRAVRFAKMTPKERSELGRKLAHYRWHRRGDAPNRPMKFEQLARVP